MHISKSVLSKLNIAKKDRSHLREIVVSLSLLVIVAVFWSLKLTGIGVAGEAFCGKPEHIHTEACMACLLDHEHTEDCKICTRVHEHDENCVSCTQVHEHDETCVQCTIVHEHTPECVQCTIVHEHTDQCDMCRLDHEHDESCKVCTIVHEHTPECVQCTIVHEHTPECVQCTIVHEHNENCPTCTLVHVHSESCTVCGLEEHIHTESCYSNLNADLETADDWEATLADMTRGPTIRENVVLVAASQLGYTESTLNFQVDADGVRHGITRYGQWYGNPYGPWSAMFVSFCLEYGGAGELPKNAGPEALRLEWEALDLFTAEEAPEVGMLLFLHKAQPTDTPESKQAANSVAIISKIEEDTLTVIEGDLDNAVTEAQYKLGDEAILGYGLVPTGGGLTTLEEPVAQAVDYTVWLDGTDGGMGHLTGSPDTAYTVQGGSILKLPETWTSPSKYSYRLRGWYDITNNRYYPAGAEMEVTGDAVLYADWVAATYDIGQFNAKVADTVSTNAFITTHMFDYNYLLNIHSASLRGSVSATDHSETWSLVASGTVAHNDLQTRNFVFIDNDSGGLLCTPNNRNSINTYPGSGIVTPGIYSTALGDFLFSPYNGYDPATGQGVLGKTYLGTGDHLFQIEDDPNSEFYGYYYYDSRRNAASYNQSNRRFYVYEYLAATSDAIGSTYADFLPLNSPYANTNGKAVGSYNYNGVDGEYAGVPHYRYDSKYNSGNYNSINNVQTEYAYGMRSDIKFFLPNEPGTGGNKDLYGNDMQFRFSGDDDLWILIDGIVVLDIGGIHGAEDGVIDFTTGQVTVQGNTQASLMELGIGAGDHTLSVCYLERGSSLSNCSIYFNMAPRFGLELRKEDVLTQEILDGAQFTVYEDLACTQPAELWISEAAYSADLADGVLDSYQSTFTIQNGQTFLWGLGSGNTYYIKETAAPHVDGYGVASGLIRLTIEKDGQATYYVDVVEDAQGNAPSNGFTVHNVKIDEETQIVYFTVTNAPAAVMDTTTVQVIKKWEDTADHSGDYILAYLTVTEADGTVRRIREITLSDENNWRYTWTNLPEKDYDTGEPVLYGIEESYESGYYSTVRRITEIDVSTAEWSEAMSFTTGQTYYFKHTSGYLSTISASDAGFTWVEESAAVASPLAAWTAEVNGSKVRFTNGAGQILSFQYNSSSSASRRHFFATTATSGTNLVQWLFFEDGSNGLRLFGRRNANTSGTKYYMSSAGINSSDRIATTTSTYSAMSLQPMTYVYEEAVDKVEDWGYQITNTPLAVDNETSMAVTKVWNIPAGESPSVYQEFEVTVRLLAGGVNTGRTLTLNLKNNWQGTFQGLPYKDANGNVISYTVEEVWSKEKWATTYGDVQLSGGSPPDYSVVITNTYHPGGPELPATGYSGSLPYILCGLSLMLGSLVYGIGSRRKRERRVE